MRDYIIPAINLVLLIFVLFMLLLTAGGSGQSTLPYSPEKSRELAATFLEQQLYKQAVQEYERYLAHADIPAEQQANILYTIGTTYLDQLHDYENALATFLRISNYYPQSRIAPKAESRMMKCYEELNRGFDAQRKLEQLTDLEKDEADQGSGPVVAQIGDQTITMSQLQNEIAEMPEYMRRNLKTPEQQLEYLKNKVFRELLYDKAIRNEYHKKKEIREQIQEYEKQLLAQTILQEEVQNKINITPSDIDLYYKAHKEEFTQPLTLKTAHIQLESADQVSEVTQALSNGMDFEEAVKTFSTNAETKENNGMLPDIQQGTNTIPGIGNAPDMIASLMELEEGAISPPLKGPKHIHIFKIIQRIPEQVKPLDQVRQQIESRVQMMKQRDLQKQLIQEMLSAEKVKIHEAYFKSAQSGPNQ